MVATPDTGFRACSGHHGHVGREAADAYGRAARWALLPLSMLGVLVAGLALVPLLGRTTEPAGATRAVVTALDPVLREPVPALDEPVEASVAAGDAPVVDEQWVVETSRAVGIPATALRAYGRAVLGAPERCELGWTTLAGIGWVESQHGTIDGRGLGDDGHSSTPVVGPALDGREGLAAIRATDTSAALHGDATWDHAVGPMQFIPSTWSRFARDGDGDGVADPYDIDDAAVAAAAYLCHDSHDLTTSAGWNAAILSYNHDNGYVVAVHEAANRYGRLAR